VQYANLGSDLTVNRKISQATRCLNDDRVLRGSHQCDYVRESSFLYYLDLVFICQKRCLSKEKLNSDYRKDRTVHCEISKSARCLLLNFGVLRL
jgi:hypothetical protein